MRDTVDHLATFAFTLNEPSYGGQQTILNIAAARAGAGGCTSQNGPCTIISFSANGLLDGINVGCTAGQLIADVVTPNIGETVGCMNPPAVGLHRYAITMNSSGTSGWVAYVDGVSQTFTIGTNGAAGNFLTGTVWLMSEIGTKAFNAGTLSDVGIWNILLTTGDLISLTHCTPPNRVRSDRLLAYWPMGGHESPEPDIAGYPGNRVGDSVTAVPISMTLTGTTFAPQDACPQGGAYP